MNLPTTNLLEWIDEMMKFLNSQKLKSYPFDPSIYNKITNLNLIRTRILQERENEKQIIIDAHIAGGRKAKWDHAEFLEASNDYYTTTFNPNNDEQR